MQQNIYICTIASLLFEGNFLTFLEMVAWSTFNAFAASL